MVGILLVILSGLLGLACSERYIVSHDVQFHSYSKQWFYLYYGNSIQKSMTIGDQTILVIDDYYNGLADVHFLISYPFINTIEIDHEVKLYNGNTKYDEHMEDKVDVKDFEQLTPPLHLDRVDQRYMPLDNKYVYNEFAGMNTTVFIVDTGIDIKHPEFEGRAEWGINTADSEGPDGCMESHGTHVAGIVGSKTYGVAKKTKLVSVKVLDCTGSGSYSGILEGLEWIAKQKVNYGIVNMSLGGPFSNILNKAVDSLSSQGYIIVSAAGNENQDACNTSPASARSSITVGSIGVSKGGDCQCLLFSTFSNYGKCVSILADGEDILSTVPKGRTSTMSGTSMASPETAGVVALYVSRLLGEKKCPSKLIKEILVAKSIPNAVKGKMNGTPNSLLYSRV
ncbi:hypothetical protein CCP3SC1AL1_990010 [Gammaproteobacteria bacterium]